MTPSTAVSRKEKKMVFFRCHALWFPPHLAACSRMLSCPSSRGVPRILRALIPHHIPWWSPCCCCGGLPPEDNCTKTMCHIDWWGGFIPIHFARGSIEVSGTAFLCAGRNSPISLNFTCSVTLTCAYWIFLREKSFHSLFFDFVGGGVCHLPCVWLRLAAVPQVDKGLANAQQHHRDPGAQAAAVTGHLQQVALHLHLPSHTVQTPVIWWGNRQGEKWRRRTRE